MNIAIRILLIILLCYVVLLLFIIFRQKRMLYFPLKEMSASPADIGLSYREITFSASDGVQLSGWFVGVDRNRDIPDINNVQDVILFCHGNGGNISHRLDSFSIFNRLGLQTFIFDYRGYGKSGGSISEKGTYLDVEAAWNYLTETEKIPPERIIIFGRSLGGPIAAHLASKVNARLLILESTFTSIPDVAAELYPFLPVRLICRFKYNTLNNLQKINMPVLVIHSPEDEMVSFSHGRKLFAAAHNPKEFLEITGSHNDGYYSSGKTYTDGLYKFLSNYPGDKR